MWLCTAKTRQLAQHANALNTQYKITRRKIEVGVV